MASIENLYDSSELIIKIRAGNEAALEKAYQLLHQKIYRYFLKRSSLQETAKELTQTCFIKLWQSRLTLTTAHSLDAQCFTIANSVLIDHLRRMAAERKNYLDYTKDAINHQDSNNESKTFESLDYIVVAAAQLPPVRKNIFMLKTIHGYTNQDVAEQLSISIKTVEDHYTKALRQIRIATLAAIPLFLLAQTLLS
jgi:RNA polymerase sigma-70 factor (ECF subfamily)